MACRRCPVMKIPVRFPCRSGVRETAIASTSPESVTRRRFKQRHSARLLAGREGRHRAQQARERSNRIASLAAMIRPPLLSASSNRRTARQTGKPPPETASTSVPWDRSMPKPTGDAACFEHAASYLLLSSTSGANKHLLLQAPWCYARRRLQLACFQPSRSDIACAALFTASTCMGSG
jgi:hypothetical protein